MAEHNSHPDAVIAGGGLHGLSTAIHLAQAGLRVVLLEKDRVGRHASGANAGGVRRLGRALAEIPLALAALERWHRIGDLIGDDCEFAATDQIKVAESEQHLMDLRARSEMLRAHGFEHEEIIGRNALRDRLPDANEDCVGGMIVRGDGHANPLRTVQAFLRKARQLGVEIHEGAAVQDVAHRQGGWHVLTKGQRFETPILVNAAGAWGGRLAEMMGDHVPLEAKALMLMVTERMRPFLSPVVGAQGRALSFKQFANGTVLIGGAYEGVADLVDGSTKLDVRGLAKNAAAAAAVFPLMRKVRIARAWTGIEGMTPDRLPVIGPGSREGAFHLFGFSAHGFALAPIGGEIIADLVQSGRSELPLSPFDAERFRSEPDMPSNQGLP